MPAFPTTLWTVIRDAGAGRATAVNEVVTRYWPAVVRFARSKGLDEAAAEDVAQEAFLRVFSDRTLARADETKGRFRNLLLSITRYEVGHYFENRNAGKRGGGRRPLSLDATGEIDEAALAAPETSDPDFDREWFALILSASLAKLEAENLDYHRCLRGFLFEAKSHAAIAASLGKTEAMVRNAISRGKIKLAKIVRDEIAAYVSSSEELEEELEYLSKLIER
jgi:RNA polymerase sigma factor (sigma-70 family)